MANDSAWSVRPAVPMRLQWLVESDGGEIVVEADQVEITAAGALAFYRDASRQETERTLLLALSPKTWRRCQLRSAV